MIKTITSAANPTVKLLAGLRSRKYRQESGLFIAVGARRALEGLRSGAIPKILAYSDAAGRQELKTLSDACLGDGGTCLLVTEKILAKIARKDNPQPLIAAFGCNIRALASLHPQGGRVFVALDRVRDPGNLGTVIRTADAVDAAGLILVGDSCDPYSAESVRAAMGSLFNVPLFAASEAEFVVLAKGWPGSVVGASLSAMAHYRGAKYAGAVLAVLGNEQSGLSPVMENSCKQTVRIPIFGRPESLNLAVAAGIFLYGIKESLQEGDARP